MTSRLWLVLVLVLAACTTRRVDRPLPRPLNERIVTGRAAGSFEQFAPLILRSYWPRIPTFLHVLFSNTHVCFVDNRTWILAVEGQPVPCHWQSAGFARLPVFTS